MNNHKGTVTFVVQELADVLQTQCPEIRFCFLLGSAQSGAVKEGSDLDLAVYLAERPSLEFYSTIEGVVHETIPHVRVDMGLLNDAEPVFRFEALKGKLLFTRSMDEYADFFSKTCREYERQLLDYERQHKYRMEVKHAV